MSLEENKQVVRRQFELLSKGDVSGAAGMWAQESFNHGRKVGPADIQKVYESLHTLHEQHDLHEVVAEGEWVAARTTCHGRHTAEPPFPVNGGIFVGIAPTGREYTVQHIHLFRVRDGRLVEHWANRDDLGNAAQIGRKLGMPQGRP